MPYPIRHAGPQDLDAVSAVENACFPPQEAATRAAFQARLSTFPESFLVALDGGRIVGLVNGCCTTEPYLGDALYAPDCPHSPEHPWQTVFGLAVLPEYQHRGIAGALLRQLIELSRQRRKAGLILTCKQEKIGFYAGFGFQCRGISASSHGGAVWYDMVLTF